MTAATLAYLARLEVWTLAVAAVQGLLAWGCWRLWSGRAQGEAPESRHRLACLHLIVLAAAPATAAVLLHLRALDMASARGVAGAALSGAGRAQGLDAASWAGLLAMAVWLAGAGGMAARLVLDAWRAGAAAGVPAPAAVTARVARLAARAGTPPPRVRIAAVATPQALGLWRPELRLPRGLWRRLPEAEFDALVLHELAHLRRGDFGWNLAQRGLLALLWIHPAAWSLYGAAAREREACCDAFAVRRGARPADLARALVRLAEGRPAAPLAMAASGGALAERVRRLVERPALPAPPPHKARGALAAAGALMLAAPLMGGLGALDPAMGRLCNASAFAPVIVIAAHDPAGAFDLRFKAGRVIAASVDRHTLPPGRILQSGDRVVLAGPRREPLVAVTLTAQGGIRWAPRSRS